MEVKKKFFKKWCKNVNEWTVGNKNKDEVVQEIEFDSYLHSGYLHRAYVRFDTFGFVQLFFDYWVDNRNR